MPNWAEEMVAPVVGETNLFMQSCCMIRPATLLSATVSSGRVAGLIDQIGGAFGLVLGMTGASALLLLISMVSAITAVVR